MYIYAYIHTIYIYIGLARVLCERILDGRDPASLCAQSNAFYFLYFCVSQVVSVGPSAWWCARAGMRHSPIWSYTLPTSASLTFAQ